MFLQVTTFVLSIRLPSFHDRRFYIEDNRSGKHRHFFPLLCTRSHKLPVVIIFVFRRTLLNGNQLKPKTTQLFGVCCHFGPSILIITTKMYPTKNLQASCAPGPSSMAPKESTLLKVCLLLYFIFKHLFTVNLFSLVTRLNLKKYGLKLNHWCNECFHPMLLSPKQSGKTSFGMSTSFAFGIFNRLLHCRNDWWKCLPITSHKSKRYVCWAELPYFWIIPGF